MAFLATLPLVELHQLTPTIDLLEAFLRGDADGPLSARAQAVPHDVFDDDIHQALERSSRKALTRTNDQALRRLTVDEGADGWRFVEQPPLLERLPPDSVAATLAGLETYARALTPERRWLIESYTLTDAAFKVVGVGSVGLRAYVLLLVGAGPDDALVLQAKEARASALAPYLAPQRFAHQGFRVTTGQRHLQSVSDPFLGVSSVGGLDFYVRQLRDMKGSIDAEQLSASGLRDYARLCGGLLAKAHARTADAAAIAGYCGTGGAFEGAIEAFAVAYADQAERDHAALVAAVAAGRLEAMTGV
jgi:uncharacterized protein (DUF2252 family)